MNYLAPGITNDKWVKTYGATLAKSWLPYEWFDSADKLDYPGLPPYLAWYSQLKGGYVLSRLIIRRLPAHLPRAWHANLRRLAGVLQQPGCCPFLEALQKMKEFYTNLGVDIFKDAVSLPSVSKQYILRKTLKRRKSYKPPDLYAPNKEAYAMLKAAVVGGRVLYSRASTWRARHASAPTNTRTRSLSSASWGTTLIRSTPAP